MKTRIIVINATEIENATDGNESSVFVSNQYDESDNRRLITENAVRNLPPTQELFLGR